MPPTASIDGTPEPSPTIKCPLVAIVAVTATADVELPTRMPLAVRLVAPVPPLPTGRIPLTPVASATSFQAGALLVPVLARYWVEVVDFARRAKAFAPLAITISPCALTVAGAVALSWSLILFMSAARTT